MKHSRIAPLFLILSLVLSTTTGLFAAEKYQPNPEELSQRLDAMVNPSSNVMVDVYGPAAGAVLKLSGPKFEFMQAAGLADVDKAVPVKVDDRFEIGSTTKIFTALIFMQLAEDGLLLLDDPLSKWLPEWAEKIPNGNDITLRQLATHTSGIRDYADALIDAGAKDEAAMQRYYEPGELIRYASDHGKPDFAPGAEGRWKYSSTGYILLGLVLEKVTEKTYSELLHERIIDPLKMDQTSFPNSVPEEAGLVQGYDSYPGGKNTTGWNLSQGWAAGGIISTANDMHKFLQAFANGRFFRDPSTLLVMAKFVKNDDVSKHLGATGYGIGLIEYAKGVWGHGGQTPGYENIMMFVPGSKFSMIALTNTAQGPVPEMQAMASVLQKMAKR